jgi:aryl-alcohol dehydrogenase-like predicted oxidoreductase
MQTRKLGTSDLELTTVGFGTWGISGGKWAFGWGEQDEAEAVAAIIKAVDIGINWIDTAPVYGEGQSEDLVAKALAKLPKSKWPLIATKCSRVYQPDGTIIGNLDPASIVKECEASLKRMGIDVIDLYQVHWPLPAEDIERGWSALVQLKEQGKVRHIGVSNFDVAQLKRVQSIATVISLQPPFSLIADGIGSEILPYCKEQNIGVIGYSPMCKGLLTGKFDKQRAANLGTDDHRSRDPKFQEPQLSINLEFVEQLKPIAAREQCTLAQLSIAWTLAQPGVTAAIVGARRPAQIEDTAPAGDLTLSHDSLQQIDQWNTQRKSKLDAIGSTQTGRV